MEILTEPERPLCYRYEVPETVLEEDFDDLDDAVMDGFIKFRGGWYNINEFLRFEDGGELHKKGWDGYYPLNAFAAVLVRLCGDDEVIMGLALC
jgi:hypothetical protein